MQTTRDKVKTLLGFALRSGKVIFGVDNIISLNKKKHIVITSSDLSENSFRRLKENISIPILICKYATLQEISYRDNCKVIAITDKQMAEAIKNNFNSDLYDLVSEGK